MINTIFYFADTQNEYMQKYNAGEISSKTITFVKDSNEIYINGHGYIDRQSIIDYLVEDAQQKDQELANQIRSELATAESNLTRYVDDATEYAEGVHDDLQNFKTEIAQDISDSITAAITNAQGRTIWTELNTTNEGISAMTTRLNTSLDAAGNVKYTSALQSVINTGISGNKAFTDIAQRYAVLDENQDIISWMTSGFKGHTNDTESFAAMYAAANQATQSAIAQVQTSITQDLQGNYVSKAGLATEVEGLLNDETTALSLAFVNAQSNINGAEARMTAKYDTLNTALGTTNTTLSEVSTVANEGKARASLLTSAGPNGGYIVNETTLESSMVSIFNKAGDASTFIQQKATKAKEDAEATAQTLINTQASNAASTYATKDSLNNAQTTIMSYITGEDGLINKEASLRQTVTADHATLSALASNLEAGTTAGVVFKSGLDDAVTRLLAQNSNANTKAAITQIASTEAASSDITTRMKNAFNVTALTDIAQKSYVQEYTNSKGEITGIVTGAINGLKAELLDKDGKPIGLADLELTVEEAVGENGTIKNAITNLTTSVANANANASTALTQLSQVDGKISTASTNLEAKLMNTEEGEEGSVIKALSQLKQEVKEYVDDEIGDVTESVNTLSSEIDDTVSELETNVKKYTDDKVGPVTQAITSLAAKVWDEQHNSVVGYAGLDSRVTTAQNTANSASSAASAATTATNTLKAAIYGDGDIPTSSATLSQRVSDAEGAINTLESDVQTLTGVSSSGIVTKSNIDEAIVEMFAKQTSKGRDTIEASIVSTVNASGSQIDLSADKINFTGSTTFNNAVKAVDITAKNIKTTDANNVVTNEINSDGSGMLANNGIKWDTTGNLTLSQPFLASLFTSLGDGATNNLSYKGVTDNISGSILYGSALSMYMPFSTATKTEDNVFMSLYDKYMQTVKDTLFKHTISGKTWYSYPKGSWDGERFVGLENTYASRLAKAFVPFDVDEADPLYKPDISYGSVIVYSNDSSSDKYPLGGTEQQKKDWYFNKISQQNLSFDRGLLVSKDPIDVVYKKTKANITGSEIDDLVYVEHDLTNDGGNAIAKYTDRLFVRAMNGEDITFKFDIQSGNNVYNTEDSVFIFKEIANPEDGSNVDTTFEYGDNDDYYMNVSNVDLLNKYMFDADFDGVYSISDLCTIFDEADTDLFSSMLSGLSNKETIGICFYDYEDEPVLYVIFEKVSRKEVTQYKDFFAYNQDKIWADTSKWMGPSVTIEYNQNTGSPIIKQYGNTTTNYTTGSWFYDSVNSLYIYGTYNIGPLVTLNAASSVTTVYVTGWLHVTTNLSNYQIEKYTSNAHPLYHRKEYTSGQDRIVIYPNNKEALTVLEGQDVYVKADVIYSSTSNPTIQWQSSSSQIASIEGTESIHGVDYTVISGNKAGTAIISASTSNGGYHDITVNVLPVEIYSITLNKNTAKLTVGQSYQIHYTEQNNANNNVKHGATYSSSDTSIATVDSNGNIKAVSPGTATIIVTSTKDLSKKDTCAVYIPEIVNLGLPSGTMWCVNPVGGKTLKMPPQYGNISYAGDGTKYTVQSLLGPTVTEVNGEYKSYPTSLAAVDTICRNSKIDVAYSTSSGLYQMPTKEQFQELKDNCTISQVVKAGQIYCVRLTSNINGNYIELHQPTNNGSNSGILRYATCSKNSDNTNLYIYTITKTGGSWGHYTWSSVVGSVGALSGDEFEVLGVYDPSIYNEN